MSFKRSILLILITMITEGVALGQAPPPGFSITDLGAFADLRYPTSLCVAPDGRVFIGLQGGDVRIWKPGVGLLDAPFHAFSARYGLETGLLGLALDPDFDANGLVYAQYTPSPSGLQRVVRIKASASNPDIAEANSEALVIELVNACNYHHAGGLRFGIDQKLYVATGNNDPQSLTSLGGKILRINPDGSIPDDNPTVFDGVEGSTSGIFRSIWAIGLRNPFRFAINSESGQMFIHDVGDASWEEINEGGPGKNFGYPSTEGPFDPSVYPDFTLPLLALPHGSTGIAGNCITGGAFYNPSVCTFPADFFEDYLFTDLSALFRRDAFSHDTQRLELGSVGYMVDICVDLEGRLLVAGLLHGVYRLEYTAPLPPVVVRQPTAQILCNGDAATLSLVVSASLPVTYQWQRNDIPIADVLGVSGSQTRELRIDSVQAGHAGAYACVIQNAYGETQTASVSVAIGPAGSGYNGAFIQDFVVALLNHSQAPTDLCQFDFSANGAVDPTDVAPMIAATLAD